jgi:hypothetical protein
MTTTVVDALSYHFKELGVVAKLTADARNLELDAPEGVLTPELVDLVREHKDELIESVYVLDEADAIAWEGCQLSGLVAIDTGRFKIGARVIPCTPAGVFLHDVTSPIAEARQLADGAWEYRMGGFTQWRDESLYAASEVHR